MGKGLLLLVRFFVEDHSSRPAKPSSSGRGQGRFKIIVDHPPGAGRGNTEGDDFLESLVKRRVIIVDQFRRTGGLPNSSFLRVQQGLPQAVQIYHPSTSVLGMLEDDQSHPSRPS